MSNDVYADVVGFVFAGMPGIADQYLTAAPGLTVLYGLNGAGKTRILQGIEKALGGVVGGASLVVRVQDPGPGDGEYGPHHLKTQLCRAWTPHALFMERRELPGEDTSWTAYYARDFERWYAEALSTLVDPQTYDPVDPFEGRLDPDRIEKIRTELQDQRLILASPVGTNDAPQWEVAPLAVEDEAYPVLTQELRRIARTKAFEATLNDDGPTEELYDDDFTEPFEGYALTLIGQVRPLMGAAQGEFHSHRAPLHRFAMSLRPVKFEDIDPDRLVLDSLKFHSEIRHPLASSSVVPPESTGWELFDTSAAGPGRRLVEIAEKIGRVANLLFSHLLLDAPPLNLQLVPVSEWWDGPPFQWRFGPAGLDLSKMSTAELRWARWAIAHATTRSSLEDSMNLTLIDEPERALHRSAEAHMASNLLAFSQLPDQHVFVSTHSPELLNVPSARLLEVRRNQDGLTTVSALTPAHREELEDLGLLPSDLLRRQRGFLLVEGEHDRALLEHWVGHLLKQLRISILVLRGAKKLPETVDSQVLFDFTDAHIFVLVDNLRAEQLTQAWAETKRLMKVRGDHAAMRYLERTLVQDSGESKWIKEWLSRAVAANVEERLTPFAIPVPDIIDLVDARQLIGEDATWPRLRDEYSRTRTSRAFKEWLRHAKHAWINVDTILSAAPAQPPRPSSTSFEQQQNGSTSLIRRTEPRWVVGFEVMLVAYRSLSSRATVPVSLVG